MIRRKNSYGFIEFIRGKYELNNIEYIQHIFNEMSNNEKKMIQELNFDELWNYMWNIDIDHNLIHINSTSKEKTCNNEKYNSFKKFENLKNGLIIENSFRNINSFIKNSSTDWTETEWEFPKGRRNIYENDLDCALREFQEETGYNKKYLKIINNIHPFEEIFIGSDYKIYKNKYFLAYMNDKLVNDKDFQKNEVSKMEWKNITECINTIRNYNYEKIELIKNINELLNNYYIV